MSQSLNSILSDTGPQTFNALLYAVVPVPSVLIKGNVGAFFTTVGCTLVPSSLLTVCVTQKKKNIKDDEKKSDVVRVHHEKEQWGESSP